MENLIIDFWQWWVAAAVLLVIEMLAPTFFALWLGLAAFFTGLLVFLFPDISWQWQVFVFAVLSVINTILWKRFYDKRPIATDEPLLSRRGERYIGRVITLQTPIIDGQSKVIIDDSTWKISGNDCPAGTKVKIIQMNNMLFQVEIIN